MGRDKYITCPPVAQSFTVELRSLGSSSPSNVFKMSYSAIENQEKRKSCNLLYNGGFDILARRVVMCLPFMIASLTRLRRTTLWPRLQ